MAKQSLASQGGAVTTPELNMPAVFGQPQVPMVQRTLPPYVVFAHPNKSDEWSKLTSKFGAVEEGQMFLIGLPESPIKLDPMRCHLLAYTQFWATKNAAGDLVSVSFKEAPDPYKEHVEAVLLVYVDGKVVPANVQFRTTKCPAVHAMVEALAACQKPDWAERSPAHKETLAIQTPFARFVGSITLRPARTSRSSGKPYRSTGCDIVPSGVAEARMLEAWKSDPKAQEQLNQAAANYEGRLKEFKGKEAK